MTNRYRRAGWLWLCLGAAPWSTAGGLAGRVHDVLSGAPLAGVTVEVGGGDLTLRTDAEGAFTLPDAAGRLRLRLLAPGYEVLEREVEAADGGSELRFELRPRELRLHEEVLVSAERSAQTAFNTARSVSVVTRGELERRFPRTTPEALMELGQVWVQKTNHGGGAPFLRGLAGNQVLLVVDGVRLNNGTYRFGPNQYLATVDPLALERLEVVRGVGSVLHGSDALGGVVSLQTRRPAFNSGGYEWGGSLDGKLASADQEQSARLGVELSGPRLAARVAFDARAFGELRAGRGLGVEAPSAYDERSLDALAAWRTGARSVLSVAYQDTRQDDVPRYDQVAQRGFAFWTFDPQVRRLGYARWQASPAGGPFESLEVVLARQRSDETRRRQTRGSSVVVRERDVIDTWSGSLQTRTRPFAGLSLVLGGELYDDRVGSGRVDRDTLTGSERSRRGLYPDGAGARSAALYAEASRRQGRLTFNLGARYQYARVRIPAEAGFAPTRVAPQAVVGQAALAFEANRGLRLYASTRQGFRAPNVDDLSTLGPFDFGIEVPSPALDPERALEFELGAKLRRQRVQGALALYRSELSDLIDRVPALYLGSPTYEGQRVFQRRNVHRAYVQGVEAWAQGALDARARWQLSANGMYTFGEVKGSGDPLRRIPPLHGELALAFKPGPRTQLLAELRVAAAQRRLAPGDKADHRINPAGTPGFGVLNLRLARGLSRGVQLVGGLENVFDEAYRIHGSGVDGQGRHAWLAARLEF